MQKIDIDHKKPFWNTCIHPLVGFLFGTHEFTPQWDYCLEHMSSPPSGVPVWNTQVHPLVGFLFGTHEFTPQWGSCLEHTSSPPSGVPVWNTRVHPLVGFLLLNLYFSMQCVVCNYLSTFLVLSVILQFTTSDIFKCFFLMLNYMFDFRKSL